MFRVLLLNADYEPLNICSMKRAMSLVYSNKADYLHACEDKLIKSSSGSTYSFPTVLRLKHQVKKNFNRIYKVSRIGVYARDNFTCQYCNAKNVELSLDHVYPKHLGGTHTWDNLVTCCKKCNGIKGWKTLEQCGMKLNREPKCPKVGFNAVLKNYSGYDFEEWKYYLVN